MLGEEDRVRTGILDGAGWLVLVLTSGRILSQEGFSLRKVSLSTGSHIRKDSRYFGGLPQRDAGEPQDEKDSVVCDKTAKMNSWNVIEFKSEF